MRALQLTVATVLVDSNEALNLNLVRAGKDVFEEPFGPTFTYPIFGEDEKIFGYSDLLLNLRFRAHDLKLSLDIQWDKKWQPIGETKAMDLKEMLKDFILPGAVYTLWRAMAVANGWQRSSTATIRLRMAPRMTRTAIGSPQASSSRSIRNKAGALRSGVVAWPILHAETS